MSYRTIAVERVVAETDAAVLLRVRKPEGCGQREREAGADLLFPALYPRTGPI